MSAIVIHDSLVHYEVMGRGRPLAFIHGWLGSWRYWVPAMEGLSVGYRAYALDLWGFGDSDNVARYYSIDAYVDLLREFLDRLGIHRVALVGHALGGVVALRFAAQFSDRVEQVMGVSVPLVAEAVNRPLVSLSGNGGAVARLVARRASFPELDMEVRKVDVAAIVRSVRSAMDYDLRRDLISLKVPVLLVHGGNDPFIRPPKEEWYSGRDANLRVIFLDGAQHFPMLEEQNKFNRLLLDFLNAGEDLASLALKEEWRRRLR